MTKEQILEEESANTIDMDGPSEWRWDLEVFNAMERYAKQEAIKFVNRLMHGSGPLIRPNIRGRWYIGDEPDANGRCTAAELWDQIKNHNK